jgi:hypothetical protein
VIPIHVPLPVAALADGKILDEAQGDIRALRQEVADLRRRVEKQAVIVRALFAFLSTKQGLTEAELLDRFRQVEAERASAPAKKCAQCGRAVNQRTQRCLYCGAPAPVDSAFDFLELGAWLNQGIQATGPALPSSEDHDITSRPGG